jgi:endonuclease/exonuclease/phosphatase family metal-dependent hydrolase
MFCPFVNHHNNGCLLLKFTILSEPTRVTKESKTLIDHIYITNLEKLQESHVVQYSVSDHYPVCMTRSEQISVKKDTYFYSL